MRALIIEDDPTSRGFLKHFLEKFGEVVVAEDGQLGLYAFYEGLEEKKPFELVCLDLTMPAMNGLQALTLIRQAEEQRGIVGEAGSKIVVITSATESKVILQSFRSGCTAFTTKPFDPKKFRKQLKDFGLVNTEANDPSDAPEMIES